MLLLPNQGSFSQSLSVLLLVALKLGDSGFQLRSSGLEQVLQDIVSSLDIDNSVLDILGESHNLGIVLVGSHIEVEIQLVQLVI